GRVRRQPADAPAVLAGAAPSAPPWPNRRPHGRSGCHRGGGRAVCLAVGAIPGSRPGVEFGAEPALLAGRHPGLAAYSRTLTNLTAHAIPGEHPIYALIQLADWETVCPR